MLELLERTASLEELGGVRDRNKVRTGDYVTEVDGDVGNAASGPPPCWSDPPSLTSSNGRYGQNSTCGAAILERPNTASSQQQSSSPILCNKYGADREWIFTTGREYPEHRDGDVGNYMPLKLPDLPVLGGQPEDWPIFYCAFTETTQAFNCTDLKNNQRWLKALKDEARETVKSLLIQPRNVSAVVKQLRFRYGRPEQLIHSQLSGI